MIIKTWRDPYDCGFNTTRPREVELKQGVTVLVGCNGIGKTTLINNIKSYAKTNNIPCVLYDNLQSGGMKSIGNMLGGYDSDDKESDFNLGIEMFCSSEGENIRYNIAHNSKDYGRFLTTGVNKLSKFEAIFIADAPKTNNSNIRIFLYDAIDSGLSIDNILEVKELFTELIESAERMGIEMYIIAVANEYEMANNEQCLDVVTGKYKTFKSYNSYKKFILKSREIKNQRNDKAAIVMQKRFEKEKQQMIKQIQKLKDKLQKAKAKNMPTFWLEHELEGLEREFNRVYGGY